MKFTIRDWLWLTLVVALCCSHACDAWKLSRWYNEYYKQYYGFQANTQGFHRLLTRY